MKSIKLAAIILLSSFALTASENNRYANHKFTPAMQVIGKQNLNKMEVGEKAGPWAAYFVHQSVVCLGVMANAAGIPIPAPAIQAVAIGAAAAAEMLPTP